MTEDELLLRETEKVAIALGRMFPGVCEVVLHDLRDPAHSIRVIEPLVIGPHREQTNKSAREDTREQIRGSDDRN